MIACPQHPNDSIASLPSQTGESSSHRSGFRSDQVGRYFFESAFDDHHAAKELTDAIPTSPESQQSSETKRDLPAYFARLYEVKLLSKEQELQCFRRLNYLKHLASKMAGCPPCDSVTEEQQQLLDDLGNRICESRNQIVVANLRLVVSLARKFATGIDSDVDDLIGPGNSSLIRAVDLFDYRLGYRFSTYAYRAIQRAMLSTVTGRSKRPQTFASFDATLSDTIEKDAGQALMQEIHAAETRSTVTRLIELLDVRDQRIVMHRFGMQDYKEGCSFRMIAEEIGLSTTRTIQRFNRSIELMRRELELGRKS